MSECPDCRCDLESEAVPHNSNSGYCDYCVRDRVIAGEKVPDGVSTNDYTGREYHDFLVVCVRCEGTGFYLVSATQDGTDCFACLGRGFITTSREEVQQAGRWSATYQSNREPGKRPVEKTPTRWPRRRRR